MLVLVRNKIKTKCRVFFISTKSNKDSQLKLKCKGTHAEYAKTARIIITNNNSTLTLTLPQL